MPKPTLRFNNFIATLTFLLAVSSKQTSTELLEDYFDDIVSQQSMCFG